MRDLDIRGAGDLLGAEQSGFISDIGFEMYQKILDEAINELKEEEFKELYADDDKEKEFVDECQLDTDMEILIPNDYVNSISERLKLYNELSSLSEEEQLIEYEAKLIDRFGPLPSEVQELILSLRLRWIGKPRLPTYISKERKSNRIFPPQENPIFSLPPLARS